MKCQNRVGYVTKEWKQLLSKRYEEREAAWIVRIILEDIMGWTPTDVVLKEDYELNDYTVDKINRMVERVAGGEPVQYVTGVALFYGLLFKVTPAVLIPRPETAQLVDMIVRDMSGRLDLSILDCGTGSGCIAIALARNLRFPNVRGIDKSENAIDIARVNVDSLKVNVDMECSDMLALPADDNEIYDVIVSNPPYIAEKEKCDMEDNVLHYEPSMALFVPDDDPLKFYRAVSDYALHALKPGGRLYFEINPLYTDEIKLLLSGYDDVSIERDIQGKMRFVSAQKNSM